MRKFLLLPILMLLCVLPAKSSLSLTMFPQEKKYVLSLAQQSSTSLWDGQLTLSLPDTLKIDLPSRFKLGLGDASLSLGYAGFWQEHVLLSSVAKGKALLYQTKRNAFALLVGPTKKSVIGYEQSMNQGEFSLLAWVQQKEVASVFQTDWGAEYSSWGVAGRAYLQSRHFDLHAELLVTPVQAVSVFISSSCTFGSSSLGFAYGQSPYPSRYSFTLELKSNKVKASLLLEDWFGAKPIYGGFSTARKRKQQGTLQFSLGTGYLLFSFSDTYNFTSRGSKEGSVLMQVTWRGAFGKVTAQYAVKRISSEPVPGRYEFSLDLFKVAFSYTEKGYEISVSDSFAIGKGIGTWKLTSGMGKCFSLALVYALTIDRLAESQG